MSSFQHTVGGETYRFDSLAEVMAKASPARSGDFLAGVAASNAGERVAAQMALADIPPKHFLTEALIPYEVDEVTRLIIDSHDLAAFAPVSHLTVGGFRDWLPGDSRHAGDRKSTRPDSSHTSTTEVYPLSLHDALPIYGSSTAMTWRPSPRSAPSPSADFATGCSATAPTK